MKYQNTLVAITALALSTLTATAWADGSDLKEIMKELRGNLIEITDGLLVNDFDRIEQGANGIAQHPQIPPAQVKRVVAELGPEMPQFKGFDVQVHDLALSIAAAAKAKDSEAVLADYQPLVAGCLGCHETFKDRVSEVLSR